MKVKVGITGGIGSGKSYVSRLLAERGYPVFGTDEAARDEMLGNAALRQRLMQLVSPDVFLPSGALNKKVIRLFLHSSPSNAARFDAEVHPCVRQRWRRWVQCQQSGIVFMECALLYEAKFDSEVDLTLAVTAPEELRVRRVMQRDGIAEATVRKWIALQMPEEEKAKRADFVIVNDGHADIEADIDNLILKAESFGKQS